MDQEFNISVFNNSLEYDRRKFVFNLSLVYDQQDSVSLEPFTDDIWYPVFHRRFGLCFTLDIAKHEDYKFVEFYKHPVAPALQFHFLPYSHPWTWLTLILHTKYDV